MNEAVVIAQLIFSGVIAMYFVMQMRSAQSRRNAVNKDSEKEQILLDQMRQRKLNVPLSEITRPKTFSDIIGQEEGIKALRAAICSRNPLHVIIYGPPGIGKTCAARLVLEEAIKNPDSPFNENSKFIEMDASCIRFDERSIADPLIGSVHDPIYQGAGAMGAFGIPQPKPGAVTKAHCGVLFLDEIGEMHHIQMNKLLKVLEDRKVTFESAYYSSENKNIPKHIHDIFKNGLPADFRLIGATTRSPEEIPPAIRSRCLEIFFRALGEDEIIMIANNAAIDSGGTLSKEAAKLLGKYAENGRDAVNIIQLAYGCVSQEGRDEIEKEDIEWVIETGRYNPKPENKINDKPQIGIVNGLAVYGANMGAVIEIEAQAIKARNGKGKLTITGIIEKEHFDGRGKSYSKKSTAASSVENVLTALDKVYGLETDTYNIHINVSGGVQMDGPSAGSAIAVAVYSAITGLPVDNKIALTGEISIRGAIKPIGGVVEKATAAMQAGANKVIIPKENYSHRLDKVDIEVVTVNFIKEVIDMMVIDKKPVHYYNNSIEVPATELIYASGQSK